MIFTATHRCDLLFYEIYQRLTLSLPRGGFNYQFSSNLPPGLGDPPPEESKPRTKTDAEKKEEERENKKNASARGAMKAQIMAVLEERFNAPKHHEGRSILCVDGDSGLLPVIRDVYQEVTENKRRQGIWLWLGDHSNADSFAHELLTVISLRIGRFQLDHALFGAEPIEPPLNGLGPIDPYLTETETKKVWKDRLKLLLDHWGVNPDDWFIVVDGRNGVGTCGNWDWTKQAWKAEEYEKLAGFLGALQDVRNERAKPKGFHILYAPFTSKRHARMQLHKAKLSTLQNEIRGRARNISGITDAISKNLEENYDRTAAEAKDINEDWGEKHAMDSQIGWEVITLNPLPEPRFGALLTTIHKTLLQRLEHFNLSRSRSSGTNRGRPGR